jgi:hypothetical protein
LKNSIILFLISPFIGVIQAFKHFRENWAKNSIWFFVSFYGFTMFRPEEMDSYRYVLKLKLLYDSPLTWEVFKSSFFTEEGGSIDIYEPVITYFLSLFTDNGNILFCVFGLVFGYFYSRNIWLLLESAKQARMNKMLWVIIFTFAFVIGFWELNGVRMWTAAHIFFYGAYHLIIKGNKKGFFIAAASMLVHFSFAMPVALLAFFVFVKLPWRILYFIFIASFFVSELNIGFVGSFMSRLAPEFLLPKISSYTSDEYVETVAAGPIGNWYVRYYTKSLGWAIFIMVSTIYFSGLTLLKSNKKFSDFFSFTLLFLTFGNLMSQMPSGGRYLTIARLFAMALMFLFYILYDNKLYKKRMAFVSPLLVFYIIISVRVAFDTVTFGTLLTNPIIAAFLNEPIPLINFIK